MGAKVSLNLELAKIYLDQFLSRANMASMTALKYTLYRLL